MDPALTARDIYWLAGIWEGEGCFGLHGGRHHKTPMAYATLRMTDRDIIERVGRLIGKRTIQVTVPDGHKVQYAVSVWSRKAVGLMMTLYALMGERRRKKMREILLQWRSSPTRSQAARMRSKGSRQGKAVWIER
jgi:hypothetical protein